MAYFDCYPNSFEPDVRKAMSYLQEKIYSTQEQARTYAGTPTPAYGGQASYPTAKTDIQDSPSRIRDKFGEIEALAELLHTRVDMLEKRLDVVLAPESPNVSPTHPTAPPYIGSHFHERTARAGEMLAGAIDRLAAITRRVEI